MNILIMDPPERFVFPQGSFFTPPSPLLLLILSLYLYKLYFCWWYIIYSSLYLVYSLDLKKPQEALNIQEMNQIRIAKHK